jgi:hypothetical protein
MDKGVAGSSDADPTTGISKGACFLAEFDHTDPSFCTVHPNMNLTVIVK